MLLALAALAVLALGTTPPATAFAKKEKKRPEAAAPYALIAGTIYRPPGFALSGATILVTPEQDPPPGYKFKKNEVLTDGRGEFAIRVPTVPMRYRVDVKKEGYQPQVKSVEVSAEERYDLSIVLDQNTSNK